MRVTMPIVVSVMCAAAMATAQTPPADQAAAAPPAPAAGAPPNPVVFTVNGEPVRAAAVRLAMQNVAGQMRRRGEQVDQDKALQIATQQVIDTKLLAQEALRRKVEEDSGKVDGILDNIEQQAGGRKALESSLGEAGITYPDLQDAVRDSELAVGLVDRDIRPTITVTDEELQSFYDKNPKMFESPEEVHARHILIKVAEDATPEQDAQAKQRAEEARKRAVSGEDFAALAKELSEGPSAPRGGDLGFFSHDQMVEPFASAAFALEPGSISQVVKTRFGYHVIKVEEKRPAGTRSLDEVKDPLRNALANEKVGEEVSKLVQSLRDKASVEQMAPPEGTQAEETAAKTPAEPEAPAPGH